MSVVYAHPFRFCGQRARKQVLERGGKRLVTGGREFMSMAVDVANFVVYGSFL